MAYNLNQHKSRPDIKVGLRLNDHYADTLLPRIKELLRHKHQGFPGPEPVDFESNHIEFLEKEDYFVRDKTDGKRYIMFFTAVDGGTAFMMDELCKFRILTGFKLPLRSNLNHIHNETMMDGEIVMEINNNKRYLRYLIFDLMVLNGNTLIEKPYSKRMGMLRHDVLEPLNTALEKNVEMKKKMPFTMEIKSMELSYGLINVLQKIPSLKHGNDGLVFVPVNHPYEPGMCKKLLLWKPITQLTIDFMIRVPYFKEEKKPIYQLFIYDDRNHKFYDHLTLEPDVAIQWQKNSPDGNIGTFWYDKNWKTVIHCEGMSPYSRDGGWRFIRFVYEKNIADHERVVERVWKNIQNAVSQDTLENRKHIIRENWKRRQSIQFPGSQPLPSPTTQIQTPISGVFGSVLPSIPPQIFSNNSSNNNNNIQLVSPSVSSSESFILFKERRLSEEHSQMLVTSPGKEKSPTEEPLLSHDDSGGSRHSYFPPVDEKKSSDLAGPSRPNIESSMKQKDFENDYSQAFETSQEKKSPDQGVSTRPHIDETLDNSMASSKNRLKKRSFDDTQHSSRDPIKDQKETTQPEVSSETSKLDRDYSLSKSDPEVTRSDINQPLEQSDEEVSNDEPIDESNDDDEIEQVSSDDDLNQKEHHRMSISSNIADIVNYESSENLSEQNRNRPIEKEKEESSADPLDQSSPMSTKDQSDTQEYSEDYCAAYENEEKEEKKKEIGCSPVQSNIPSPEQPTFSSIPVQDTQILQQQKKKSFLNPNQLLNQIQPLPQPQSPLEQDNRFIPQPKNDNQETALLQKTQDNRPKIRSDLTQSQNRMPTSVGPQASVQENRTVSYNNVQRISTQTISAVQPTSQGQVQDNKISETSSSQQYRASDNQSNSTQLHKIRPLKSANQLTSMEDIQSTSLKGKVTPQSNIPTSNINTQSQYQEPFQLSQPHLSQQSSQESHSSMIFQQSRRQTISDSRSIITSQPQKIHIPHSIPAQMHVPLQEKQLTNSSLMQPMGSQSAFQSQVATQDQIQPSSEYQRTSNSQYINLNMEQERFITKNYNNSNFQQTLKPMTRRHTLSSTNNPLYQQNLSNSYPFPMTVSSYPPPRQEIFSSNLQPISPPHSLPLHSPVSTISQESLQTPEEYNNINYFTHNIPLQQLPQTTQQIEQQNILPILRPTPQKRKSKGALDFILNSGGGSNQKRSKYDNEND